MYNGNKNSPREEFHANPGNYVQIQNNFHKNEVVVKIPKTNCEFVYYENPRSRYKHVSLARPCC